MGLSEFYIIFTLGLLSSLHCVQMCGPFVLAFSLPLSTHRGRVQALAHLAYNSGRIITYTGLGAIAGLLGGTLGWAGRLAGIENVAALTAGGLMVIAGLVMLDIFPSKTLQKVDLLRITARWLQPLGRRIAAPTAGSKFGLGLMMGFLPCGLVYAALLKAVATGTVFAGAMTMTAFGLGTTSALFAVGMFSSVVGGLSLGRWGSRLAAVSVTLLGAFLVWRGIMPLMQMHQTQGGPPHCH